MFYLIKMPRWLTRIYHNCIWQIKTDEKILYLSFDDGPHPVATNFVLDTLKQFDAKATFFCIGNNVAAYTELYNSIIEKGHAIGNHTYDHLNGWTSKNNIYFKNIEQAQNLIKSTLFRPPFGKITFKQINYLLAKKPNFKIIMWSVLSADFDKNITKEKCLKNVLENTTKGSIIVFHDSEKAFENLRYALPKFMEYYARLGYRFEKIES